MKTTVSGPDIAVVGWIPRLPPLGNNLPPGYGQWVQGGIPFWPFPHRQAAMVELFKSGNVPAPDPLGNMRNLASSKDFRVAIALSNVSVVWDDALPKPLFSYVLETFPGYTPHNAWTQSKTGVWQVTNKGSYWMGGHRRFEDADGDANQAVISVVMRVKLSWWLNFGQFLLTFHLAPWAIVQVTYLVNRTGQGEVRFSGSVIPSQDYYVTGNCHARYDMKINTAKDVGNFMAGGICRDALVYDFFTFPF